MASRNFKSRQPKTQPKPQALTRAEVQRIAEKLACALEHDHEDVSLLSLLIDHLARTHGDLPAFSGAVFTIKRHLFSGTLASETALERFESDAYQNRDNLLKWPSERRA